MPKSTNNVLDTLGINKKDRNLKSIENVEFLNPGTILKEAKILFKKIENDN